MKELEGKTIAIARVRGRRGVKPKIRKTLELLKLHRPNHVVVYKATPSLLGMLRIVKDYVTFGEVSKETLERLVAKRGEKGSRRAKELYNEAKVREIAEKLYNGEKVEDIDPVFRLHPPRGGWKSIKAHYPKGALGNRGSMDELLRRMM